MKKFILLLFALAALTGAAQAKKKIDLKGEKLKEKTFFANNHYSYLGWGIVGAGYPLAAHASFVGRHGGSRHVFGFGYWASAGMEFGGKPVSGSTSITTYPHYSVGLKLFPYKSIFLSAGYGTLGAEKMQVSNSDEGRFNTEGWRQGKGLMLTGGYDLLGNLNGGGAFLSLSAGVGYDMYLQSWKPMASLRFGVAWGL
jgi:hypothetical protein